MKNKLYTFLLIGGLAVTGSGCSDYLDIYDKTTVSPNVFPTTIEQLDLMVNAVYGSFKTQGLYSFYWFPMGMYLYDNTSDLAWQGDPERNGQMLKHTDPTCTYLTLTYADIFKSIELANAVLDAVPAFEAAGYATDADRSALDFMKGQALFYRALAYWHGQIFCELQSDGLALPLMRTVPKTLDEMMAPRATTAAFWEFIIQDLKEAIPLLQGRTDPTRVTEWAAKGLLAKVYAQAGSLPEAKPVLKDIIDHSGKELVAFDIYKQMFFGDSEFEFTDESLYEIDMTTDMQQWGPWGNSTTGSGMQMVFAPYILNLNDGGKPLASGWSNNFVHDKNLYRFGLKLPVPERISNPAYDPSKPLTLDNLDKVCTPEYLRASEEMRTDQTVDPRLFVSCGQPFVEQTLMDDGQVTVYHQTGDVLETDMQRWSHRKFTNIRGTEGAVSMNNGANFPVIRLADIYLLYAEACAADEPAVALEYINKVKRRAYGYPADAPSPVDYKSLHDRTMARDGDHLANDPLKYERWAELFAEGQWWYDVRRWRIGPEEARYYEKTRVGNLIWPGDAGYVQPIPKTEMDRNKNMVQTPGY